MSRISFNSLDKITQIREKVMYFQDTKKRCIQEIIENEHRICNMPNSFKDPHVKVSNMKSMV